MFERFTRNARTVVIGAQEAAHRHGASEIRPAHLLESLTVRDGILAMQVLADLGAPGDEVRRVVGGLRSRYADDLDAEDAEALKLLGIDLDDVLSRIEGDLGERAGRGRGGHTRFTKQSKKVLELSLREALRLGDGFIGSEHILLGLMRSGDHTLLRVLAAFDLDPDDVRRAIDEADRRAG
ncbi:MAG TPA: Clp protease N-terminal domain-containing protein [Nocardioides sp.]|uniref:Clp protease N-terminal domain-containing protein n=1 Tax=Nocardioides sp. TaxID=35761 RepID=UPI002E2EBCAD|nr:Clp protease N-terminal domain-containing protein [Nocardioides sp.]HEX5090808.1 Clp protease N-terminal domain-containing protein [Nocardioides sp.]